MVKTFYDPKVEQRGIEKGIEKGVEKVAKEALKLGMDIETVSKISKLPIERILEIKEKLSK